MSSLHQALALLESGKILIMYSATRCRVFYKSEWNPDKYTICYVNCTKWPGLMDVGEWDWYIFLKGNKEQSDPDIINSLHKAKNQRYYELTV